MLALSSRRLHRSMEPLTLTERLLNDAGGWQVMKQARVLHEAGKISEATWDPPILRGRVREGETEYRGGLRIVTKTNIENLCGCRLSRQRGAICHHSVAVGLQILNPTKPPSAVASPPAQPAEPAPPSIQLSAEAGIPLQISVIFPPTLRAAWEKNGITTSFEAMIGGKKGMLGDLSKTVAYQADPADRRFLPVLLEITGGELSPMAILSKEPFLRLIQALVGHPRVTFGRSTGIAIRELALRPPLRVKMEVDGAAVLRVDLPPESIVLVAGSAQPWLLLGTEFRPVAPGLPPPYHMLLAQEVRLGADQAAGFLQRELPGLSASFEIETPDWGGSSLELEALGKPSKPRFTLQIEGSLNHIAAKLEAIYEGKPAVLLSSSAGRQTFVRDISLEATMLDRLGKAGFSPPAPSGELVLKGESKTLAFFAHDLPWWEKNAKVTVGARFQHVTRDIERISARLDVKSSGENWFDIQMELGTPGGERFSGAEIQRLLQSGQSHLKRKNGQLAVFDPQMLEEFQQVLEDCNPRQPQAGVYRIDRKHAAYLNAVAEEQGSMIAAPAEWKSWAAAPRQLESLSPIPLGDLEAILRPYQKQGVFWMNFLARNGLAGILADEMGLGKTLQALAFLRSLPGKSLIVCPSSLVYNWQREAAKFTPDRHVLAIEGPNRDRLFGQPLADADIIVTSYPLLRRDADRYRNVEFAAAILDEAQHIKNPDTQNAQAAFGIRARHRFALTGTPVENSVRDLWALMNFLMPGYLGTRNDFKERYEQPISTESSGNVHKRLVKRLKPFVLRRLKHDVVTDLPDKIEQVAYCELTAAQQAAYAELLSATRRQTADLAGAKDKNKARMLILTALLRLRQACCDLRLLNLPVESPEEGSAKITLLGELLEEAVDGGHRVLVFSQFATMLGLLKEWLDGAGIEYCHLDGSTKDRGAQVDRFQNGTAPVFLISLKAGGVGLNLTAADTVIHFDPWWNPAVEAQATDRAHRIGQKKVVTAYKLIARGTVEEKILALQTRKRAVIDATLENETEQPLMHGLSMQDLQDLLE